MAYTAKNYDHLKGGAVKGLSDSQLDQHFGLYKGYVTKLNEIEERLATVDNTKPNYSYNEYSELKRREAVAFNGSFLHELYFENLGADSTISAGLKAALDAAPATAATASCTPTSWPSTTWACPSSRTCSWCWTLGSTRSWSTTAPPARSTSTPSSRTSSGARSPSGSASKKARAFQRRYTRARGWAPGWGPAFFFWSHASAYRTAPRAVLPIASPSGPALLEAEPPGSTTAPPARSTSTPGLPPDRTRPQRVLPLASGSRRGPRCREHQVGGSRSARPRPSRRAHCARSLEGASKRFGK
ncbi:MAG: Superoxide dismutase [Holophagaceae bacterium]|nr:Superoxide dismutase [Holophagaceae bacterium]